MSFGCEKAIDVINKMYFDRWQKFMNSETLAKLFNARSVDVQADSEIVRFHYRLLQPTGRKQSHPYPLVVFLHGAGERGNDNIMRLEYFPAWLAKRPVRRTFPCFVLAARCRDNCQWNDCDWENKQSVPLTSRPSVDLSAAIEVMDTVIASEPVDVQRIYLVGLSMGGYGAWDLVSKMPSRFAAVVPICGGGDKNQAEKISHVPIWCFHGASDAVVPVERSRSMIAAIRSAGGRPQYSE